MIAALTAALALLAALPATAPKKSEPVGASFLSQKIVDPPIPGEESLFAELGPDGTVLRVIVISQEMVDTGRWGDPKNWIRTSPKGTIRKNYAGYGFKYDKARDAFIAPRPCPEAVLNPASLRWNECPLK